MLVTNDIANLIARTSLRDRPAFAELYSHTSAKLFGVLVRILKDRAEAEDALQEVYIRVWQKAGGFSADRASPMTWLITIARNHGIDRLRTRRESTAGLDEAEQLADSAPTPEASVIAGSERARIDGCLDLLEAEKADAVRAAYIEGYAYQELADRFDVPINTMRTWLRRSLQRLKECLSQ